MLREKLRSHYSVKIYRAQMFKLIKVLPYKFRSLILLFISPHKVLFALGTEWRQTKIFSYCRLIDRSGDSFFFFSLRLLFEEIIYYFSKQRWLNRFTVISLQFSINQGHYLYSLWQRFPVEWSVNLLLIFCFQQSALTELCVERVGRLLMNQRSLLESKHRAGRSFRFRKFLEEMFLTSWKYPKSR